MRSSKHGQKAKRKVETDNEWLQVESQNVGEPVQRNQVYPIVIKEMTIGSMAVNYGTMLLQNVQHENLIRKLVSQKIALTRTAKTKFWADLQYSLFFIYI